MDAKKELKILLWIIVTFTVRNSPYIPFLNMIFNKNKLLLKCGFVQIKYYLCPDIIFRILDKYNVELNRGRTKGPRRKKGTGETE